MVTPEDSAESVARRRWHSPVLLGAVALAVAAAAVAVAVAVTVVALVPAALVLVATVAAEEVA